MGKIIDRVRARQDLIEARERMHDLFEPIRKYNDRILRELESLDGRLNEPGEVMLMCNRGDEVQH